MNFIQQFISRGRMLDGFAVFVSACSGIQAFPADSNGTTQITITPELNVEWIAKDKIAVHVALTNDQTFHVCFPTFAKSEAGSSFKLLTSEGKEMQPKLAEDIYPQARVDVDNIAPQQRFDFVVPISIEIAEEYGNDFVIQFETRAVRCKSTNKSLEFPLKGEIVRLDSGAHAFSRSHHAT